MMEIRAATPADVPGVERLLTDARLPLDGAADAFDNGVVAVDEGGLVAAAAVERYADAALLRSVVVREDRRSEGLGQRVVEAVERLAGASGGRDVYLLTETAAAWFERLGYRRIARDAVPGPVRRSVEFTTACADTAIAMVKPVQAPERT